MAVVGNVKGIQNTNGDQYLYEDEASRRMLAPKFDATQSYSIGDIVEYNNKLYKFKAVHTGAWSDADADETQIIDEMGDDISGKVGYTDITDAFDSTQAYAIGDIVIYNNALYKFKAAHTADDPWSASEVDAIKLADIIQKTSFTYDSANGYLVINQSTY